MRSDSPAGHGLSGTLRIGFTEDSRGRGLVPESFRRFRELQREAETPALTSAIHYLGQKRSGETTPAISLGGSNPLGRTTF
jgi:hypothetical protein